MDCSKGETDRETGVPRGYGLQDTTNISKGPFVRGHSPYRTPTHRNIIPIHRNIIPALRNIIPALRNTIPIYLSALHFLSFYVHSTSFPSLLSPFSIYIPLGHLVRVS